MKKVLFALFALVLCLGMTSCGKKDPKEAAADVKSIVEKAKTDGAKWSVEDWKSNLKDVLKATASIAEESKEFDKKIEEEKDEAKKAELVKQAEEKFGEVKKAYEEFMTIAAQNENFQKLMTDEAFKKELEKEFPDIK